jgi:regulator of protease activity HflC (stomatin/prohibitin superfamily)
VEEQRAEEYQYRIRQAEQEAARKAIEAKGIRDFQEAVTNRGDFKDYLRYTGIQASLELAKSNNSKIVVFGGPAGGLPLIFNAEADRLDATKPTAPHAEAEATPTPPKPATSTSPIGATDKPRATSTP